MKDSHPHHQSHHNVIKIFQRRALCTKLPAPKIRRKERALRTHVKKFLERVKLKRSPTSCALSVSLALYTKEIDCHLHIFAQTPFKVHYPSQAR